jgi:hypothetical protein
LEDAMPANLVPNDAIPELAAQVDSPAMLRMLRFLQQNGYIQNSPDVDRQTAVILQGLANLGLVDPGYEGETNGKPYMWVSNANGARVLRYIESSPSRQAALESSLAVHPRAQTVLSALSYWDRLKVLSAAEALQSADHASWPREEVNRLEEDKPIYLLRVSPDLRAFIRILDSGELELLDVVRKEALQLFHERQRATGAHQ